FHPRAPSNQFVCDLALVADRDESVVKVAERFLLEAARALPNFRFVLAGDGWEGEPWPENVWLREARSADARAHVYSSARLVLVQYAKLPRSRQFEQRIARKFYEG